MRTIDLSVVSSDITLKKTMYSNPVLITSGSVNDIICNFDFSSSWNDYPVKTAVFKGCEQTVSVLIKNNSAIIPWECIKEPNGELFVGVIGNTSADVGSFSQLNTEYFSLGIIYEGTDISSASISNPPSPDLAEQLLIDFSEIKENEENRIENENSRIENENKRIEYYDSIKELSDAHSTSSITSENGVHNLRYSNGNLEVFENGSWTNVGSPYKIMTAVIDLEIYNPTESVTYDDDAVLFNPGGAEWDEFFGYYPVLLKDKIEVGRLDRNDFSKFEDGTPINNENGDKGDVCIAFPRFGIKVFTSGTKLFVSITNHPNLTGFNYRSHPSKRKIFYVGAYKASLLTDENGNNVLASVSGMPIAVINNLTTARNYARSKNGELFSHFQRQLIQCMFILKYKSLDSQKSIAYGYVANDNKLSEAKTGATDAIGMNSELLTSDQKTDYITRCKAFGLEDLWGTMYEWLDGIFTRGYDIFTSVASNSFYNTDRLAESYISGYMSLPNSTSTCAFIPCECNGSNTTFFNDWTVAISNGYCIAGGNNTGKLGSGIFCIRLGEPIGEEGSNYDKSARLMFL